MTGTSISRIGGAIAAAFGALALLGWALGLPFLASLGADRIPMAPSTAVLFVLYGIAAILGAGLPPSRGAIRTGVAVASAGALVALLLLILSSLGVHPAAEHLGFAITGTLGETPIGHMSPVTALCFLLASASFLGSLAAPSRRLWRARAAWWTACLLLATSCLMVLAYVFGSPLFYAGSFIPPAATTSLAFAALGTALLTQAGRQARPAARATVPSGGAPRLLVPVFVLFALSIVGVGGLYYRTDAKHHRTDLERQLSVVAELKAGELSRWRSEAVRDASSLLADTSLSSLMARVLDHPADAGAREQLRLRLDAELIEGWDQISLLDATGAQRLAVPEARAAVASVIARRVPDVLRSGEVTVEDLYRSETDGRVYLSVLGPLLDERRRARGVVALRIDPEEHLFPLLDSWPTPARTGETLLVRRDGEDALFLNELRFQKQATFTVRIPLAKSDVATVKAAQGQEGIVEALDHRGVPVIAALRAVSGSPWFLVARVDADEANAPLRALLWTNILVLGALLAAGALGTGLVHREQRVRHLQEVNAADRERAWLHDVVARSFNEVYVFDPETLRFRFVNLGACRNIGYTPEELARLTPVDLKPEFTEATFRAMLEPLRSAVRPPVAFETVHRRKDGSEYPVEVNLQLVDSGTSAAFLAIINDITERKRTRDALRSAEARYRSLFEQSPDGVLLIDAETGTTIEANEAASRHLGYTREEFAALRISDYEVNETQEETRAHLQRVLAQGSDDFETLQRTKNGAIRNVHVWTRTLQLGGRPALHTIFEDITERKGAEREILAEKSFSEAMLDSLPGIFYLFDQTGRFLRWNHAFETVSGYSAEEIAAMRPLDFFTGEDRTLIEQRIGMVFEVGTADAEATLVSKDGRRTPHYFVGLRFAVGGVPCCIGTGIDVTARRLLEDQLRQSQKIEAIGRLAGGVAHDFNNVLAVILGYGEMAQHQLPPDHPVRPRVDQMVKAATRAAALTRQLLAFSRKQVLQPKVLDLNATIADTHKLLGRLIGEDIAVLVRPALHLGKVKADPGMIEQIILNLAVNARDAMPEGGTLTLETANFDFDEDYVAIHVPATPGPYVRLTVSDTGIGMGPETLNQIFEPFFTTKPEGEGTGLGLATVYGIVKQSNGFIWVYSEPGRGTTFKIYLPRFDEPSESAPAKVAPAPAPRGHEAILLVEDKEDLREVIRETLEDYGYTVLLASNGEEAMAVARAHPEPIDLLLTDIVMPKLDGGGLAQLLSALRPTMRLLYMSGYTNSAISQHGVLGPGVMLLEKPFTRDALARAVREALDSVGPR